MTTQPKNEQIKALLENDNGGPIRMLNLLKFKEFADYGDGIVEYPSVAAFIAMTSSEEYQEIHVPLSLVLF